MLQGLLQARVHLLKVHRVVCPSASCNIGQLALLISIADRDGILSVCNRFAAECDRVIDKSL
ncbi:hypothetical protein ABW42_00650 [Stenotrophomonas maltophilia]|nr:hypothetical protein ABW42_00650 [Stenotrophomonas maltophilia]